MLHLAGALLSVPSPLGGIVSSQMRQVSCGKVGLAYEVVEGEIQAFGGRRGAGDWDLRVAVEQLGEAWTDDVGVAIGKTRAMRWLRLGVL